MSVQAAQDLAQQAAKLGWNPRVEFAGYGEPTLHPYLVEMVRAFRAHLPRAYIAILSNGAGLLSQTAIRVDKLFSAGLNTLALERYGNGNTANKVLAKSGREWLEYPADPAGNPHKRHAGAKLVAIEDITTATAGNHNKLDNRAGSSGPRLAQPLAARCAEPFRKITVRHDGMVALCCRDVPQAFKVGNALSPKLGGIGLQAVWEHDAMQAARRALYAGQRGNLHPCAGCDFVSTRAGLLPDKMGKNAMMPPLPNDAETIAAALAGGTHIPTVRDYL